MASQLPYLSAERVRAELMKTLEAKTAGDVVRLMNDEGILEHFLPEATNFDRLSRLVKLEETLRVNDPLRRLAAVLALNGTDLDALSARLRLSNAQGDRLEAISEYSEVIKPALGAAERDVLLYRIGAPAFRDAVLVGWAGANADDGWAALVADGDDWQPKKFPLQGADVMALGVPRGPEVGVVLRATEDWWIEDGFRADRASCLRQLKTLLEQLPG
jgi:poly(A) polymerase